MFKHKDHAFTEYVHEYEHVICENCGKDFGEHYGLECQPDEVLEEDLFDEE